jgi:coenzyme F420-reducing hydrogenase alpha subunit
MSTKTIHVKQLARVEGEGALYVKVKDNTVTGIALNIYEPPRFFEALLDGRTFTEPPDITARICGICPVAYQMSAVHALENACGISVGGQLRALRRLLYCGEWIESHVLHIYMLHAPDFLGYDDVIGIAKDHPEIVNKALRLKKAGNSVVAQIGGREIHPINVRVGGFYRVPTKKELEPLAEELKWAREAALDTVRLVATFPMPQYEHDYEFVSLRHPSEYPFNEGHIVSNNGLDITADEYEHHFKEEHVERSTALHSVLRGHGPYLVGPLARYSLNYDLLSPLALQAARDAKLAPTVRNPFQSIVVRAVETVYAVDEALRIIEEYERPEEPSVTVPPRATRGSAATEAPRGLLYHRYDIDIEGNIASAKIIPPTSQNQRMIETDLLNVVKDNIDMPKPELTQRCEQAIRNYDPCISCSTHFLSLEIDRE